MPNYTVITVDPSDLLPQVVGELLEFAVDPNHVNVVHGERGREIHAHPDVAEAWYQARLQKDAQQEAVDDPKPEPQPVPQPNPPGGTGPAGVLPVREAPTASEAKKAVPSTTTTSA